MLILDGKNGAGLCGYGKPLKNYNSVEIFRSSNAFYF
jgi:hypothetical protein